MKRLTRQECFNKVWKAFVVQGKPKSSIAGCCLYQHPTIPSHGCAIGVCLTQTQRDEFGDCFGGVEELFITFPHLAKRFPEKSIEFLRLLQGTHDDPEPGQSFTKNITSNLREFAKDRHLTIPKG